MLTALVEKVSMAELSKMKTSRLSTLLRVSYLWLTQVETLMVPNSSLLLLLLLILMANMLSSAKLKVDMILSKEQRDLDVTLRINPLKEFQSVIVVRSNPKKRKSRRNQLLPRLRSPNQSLLQRRKSLRRLRSQLRRPRREAEAEVQIKAPAKQVKTTKEERIKK